MRIALPLPFILALTPATIAGAGEEPAASPPAVVQTAEPGVRSVRPDADRLFDMLVQRYRALDIYRDSTRLVQVIERFGEEPTRTETQMTCEVSGEQLTVTTPQRDLVRRLGIPLDAATGDGVDDALLEYDFWLAPHMAIKFSDAPLAEMRPGVCDTFTPTDAGHVTIDDREMVHLELKTGDRYSEDYEAKFDLYVNPESMLIERIEGDQRLPDGAHCQTTLEITPESAEDTDEPAATTDALAAPSVDGEEEGAVQPFDGGTSG